MLYDFGQQECISRSTHCIQHKGKSLLPELIRCKTPSICLWLLCMIGLGLWPVSGAAQGLESLQNKLWSEQKAKEKTETHLSALTDKERSLHQNLSSLEQKIGKLEEKEKKLEAQRKSLVSEQGKLESQILTLRSQAQKIRAEMHKLLPRLWEVSIRSDHLKLRGLDSWPEADRHKVWLAKIAETAQDKAQSLRKVQSELKKKVHNLNATRSSLEAKSEELAAMNKELASNKLKFLKKLHAVRQKQQAAEQELSALKKSIDQLKDQVQTTNTHDFSFHKGDLPWPAKGKLIIDYGAGQGKFNNGMGFALSQGADIRAISRGQVVYNDTLRGFGRVVIIYHGMHYYSLYAFLAQSTVRTDQEVAKGEVIGEAGYYPESNGPGLYFELRQRQTSIDPRNWLAKR